ncbi:MAG: serine/threonine-protein kinase [Planctomycetota bacterium]|nr:serine/threonine-protein kinase [Planctomycetota bacterium]
MPEPHPESKERERFLVWSLDGEDHRRACPERGSLTLGSSPGEGQVLVLDQPGVDATHCIIGRTKSGGWAIKDLGSHSGTRINGEKVAGARLRTGDRIELGTVSLEFVDPSGPRPKPKVAASASRRLGGFRIEERLGRGGMGEVLAAVQESLDRKVALKLLNRRLSADEDFVRRFQAEARAAAALNHPNVVHVYDVGVVDGQHYLAMELMAGGTLEGRLARSGPIPPAEVVTILQQIAQALIFAEGRGIVHRDIKPDNLMVDAAGTVKLADLGLATTSEAEHQDGDQRILGTPHFMAPEQARGGKVDQRSDLYALGGTAYRLLTGHTPFEGQTTRDILRAHFTEPAQAPSLRVPQVPPALDDLVLRLLAKEPEQRFQSARQLAEALEGLVATPEAAAGSKLPLIAGAVVALAAAGFFLLQGGGDPDEPPVDPTTPGPTDPLVAAGDQEGPGELPAMPDIPLVAEDTPTDNDALLENLEKLARQAYGGLTRITDPSDRKLALEELAASFPGTSTATEALAEALALEEQLASEAASNAAADAERKLHLASLGMLVKNAPMLADGSPAEPAALLSLLLAQEAPGDPAFAAEFEIARAAELAKVLDAAQGHALAELAQAESQAAVGDFDGYQETLESLLPYFEPGPLLAAPPELDLPPGPGELPDIGPVGIGGGSGKPKGLEPAGGPDEGAPEERLSTGPQPSRSVAQAPITPTGTTAGQVATPRLIQEELLVQAGWGEFEALGQLAAERLGQRASREATWRAAQAAADRKALAADLGRGLLDELQALELDAAAKRLEARAAGLRTQAAVDAIGRLAREARQAQASLALLVDGFGAGDWRRDSVPDPAGGYVQALGVDTKGITVDGSSGTRQIPWRSYGSDPRLVDLLFKNRLRRDYTAEENLGIASLARFGAVLAAIGEADAVLLPSVRERFGPSDREQLLEQYELAASWCTAPEALAADSREVAAAAALAGAIEARVADDPSTAAALLGDLLDEHRHSLLVLLLSDGRGPGTTE